MGLVVAEACPGISMRWFAVAVRPQHEKAVADRLAAKSLETFLPLYRERRRWSDRIRTLELPLFSRYVFCRFSYEQRLKVLATPSVQSIVGFGGEPTPVRNEEIESLKSMVGSGLPVAPWHYVSVGNRVRIDDGPLAGIEGILAREKSGCRVVVSVELLQCAAAVEIDRDSISPL